MEKVYIVDGNILRRVGEIADVLSGLVLFQGDEVIFYSTPFIGRYKLPMSIEGRYYLDGKVIRKLFSVLEREVYELNFEERQLVVSYQRGSIRLTYQQENISLEQLSLDRFTTVKSYSGILLNIFDTAVKYISKGVLDPVFANVWIFPGAVYVGSDTYFVEYKMELGIDTPIAIPSKFLSKVSSLWKRDGEFEIGVDSSYSSVILSEGEFSLVLPLTQLEPMNFGEVFKREETLLVGVHFILFWLIW